MKRQNDVMAILVTGVVTVATILGTIVKTTVATMFRKANSFVQKDVAFNTTIANIRLSLVLKWLS